MQKCQIFATWSSFFLDSSFSYCFPFGICDSQLNVLDCCSKKSNLKCHIVLWEVVVGVFHNFFEFYRQNYYFMNGENNWLNE